MQLSNDCDVKIVAHSSHLDSSDVTNISNPTRLAVLRDVEKGHSDATALKETLLAKIKTPKQKFDTLLQANLFILSEGYSAHELSEFNVSKAGKRQIISGQKNPDYDPTDENSRDSLKRFIDDGTNVIEKGQPRLTKDGNPITYKRRKPRADLKIIKAEMIGQLDTIQQGLQSILLDCPQLMSAKVIKLGTSTVDPRRRRKPAKIAASKGTKRPLKTTEEESSSNKKKNLTPEHVDSAVDESEDEELGTS